MNNVFKQKAIIRTENIVKNYLSGTETLHILKGINLQIEEGKSVAISGQSGSGKSTLLNIIGGLDRTDGGRVFIGGDEITGLGEKELSLYRSKRVGFIFQFHYLLKDFTALENIVLPAYIAGQNKRESIKRAKSLLADVKLEERARHFPSQLSGGERQRVAVARSMVNDPAVILADEPTGNLDAKTGRAILDVLINLHQVRKQTILLVTHDPQVASLAQRTIHLVDGRMK
jgi:lipoprotein-releasing system ATP-binding protein